MYKKSMFNYQCEDGKGNVLLYNSIVGFSSLTKISTEAYNELCSRVAEPSIDHDSRFLALKEKGFFVSESTDEKLIRDLHCIDAIEENTLRLVILPTEKCNFRCKYCYESFEKGKMSQETQDSLIKFVKNHIYEYAALDVRWFGGEPLEAIDVVDRLSNAFMLICKNARRNYSASITTNGYHLSLDVFKKL